MDDTALAALRASASAVIDIGVALLVGAVVHPALMPGPASAWAIGRTRAVRRVARGAIAVALAGCLGWIGVEAMDLTELAPWDALAASWPIVSGTRAGQLWAVQVAALAACGAASLFDGRGRTRAAPALSALTALALLVLAGARASAGHAGSSGIDAATAVMALHLLATGAWAGAVIVGAAAVLRARERATAHADLRRYLARLSGLATAALALVVLTGVAVTWHAIGGRVRALAPVDGASAWAWTLDAKLALVAAAVALGAFNRLVAMPPLMAVLASDGAVAAPLARFVRVLRVEAVVLAAVLAAAALLANGEPPPRPAPAALRVPQPARAVPWRDAQASGSSWVCGRGSASACGVGSAAASACTARLSSSTV